MKANKDKYPLNVNNDEHVSIKIHNTEVENSDYHKRLRIKSDFILRILWMNLR